MHKMAIVSQKIAKAAVAVLGKNVWGLAPHHLGGNNG